MGSGLLAWDRLGRVYVTAERVETVPGVFETVLEPGWYPGLPKGWEIVSVEMMRGRPRYFIRDAEGKQSCRCLRLGRNGWCRQRVLYGAACRNHKGGDHTLDRDCDILYAGDTRDMAEGYMVAGFVPGTPGGITYWVRDPKGNIAPRCCRIKGRVRRTRCLRWAGQRTGRHTGACLIHGGMSTGRISGRGYLVNLLNPVTAQLIKSASDVDPSVEQAKERADRLRLLWLMLIRGITRRQEYLAEHPNDRMEGLAGILDTARNIVTATGQHATRHATDYERQAKVWAARAYLGKISATLIAIAADEGEEVEGRMRRNLTLSLSRLGVDKPEELTENFTVAQDDGEETTDLVSADVLTRQSLPKTRQELQLVQALELEEHQLTYRYIVEAMGEKMYTLYPLMKVLEEMQVGEVRAKASSKVINQIMKVVLSAQQQQTTIDKAMSITFSHREAMKLSELVANIITRAIQNEHPAVQRRIIEQFMIERQKIELPGAPPPQKTDDDNVVDSTTKEKRQLLQEIQ